MDKWERAEKQKKLREQWEGTVAFVNMLFDRLSKAEEIIRKYVRIQNACFDNADDDYMAKRDLLAKAEDFLKE